MYISKQIRSIHLSKVNCGHDNTSQRGSGRVSGGWGIRTLFDIFIVYPQLSNPDISTQSLHFLIFDRTDLFLCVVRSELCVFRSKTCVYLFFYWESVLYVFPAREYMLLCAFQSEILVLSVFRSGTCPWYPYNLFSTCRNCRKRFLSRPQTRFLISKTFSGRE